MKFNWRLHLAMKFTNGRCSMLYRDDERGVQCEITPAKGKNCTRGKARYYIDNDAREFVTEKELAAALESKVRQVNFKPEEGK